MQLFVIILVASNLIYTYFLTKKVNKIFTGIQKGDENRKWRGYWKIHPDDRIAIANDPRTCEEIAKAYNVSRSYISQIKRDYKTTL